MSPARVCAFNQRSGPARITMQPRRIRNNTRMEPKPVQLEEFETLLKSINDFWLMKVELPSKADAV